MTVAHTRPGDFDTVPVIDFAGMLGDDPKAKAAVAARLRDACANVGFFYLANHGIPQTLVDAMFAECPRFFGLPLEDKMRLHVRKSSTLLGYVTMKDENADPSVGQGDLHEAFDFASEEVVTDDGVLHADFRQAGNLWPDNLPGFRETMTRYSIAVRLLARRIFGAFALALDLPEDHFLPLTDRHMSLIRILYYPSQPGPLDERQLGTGAHTDHECFTILFQDRVQALQVKNKRGEWIDAPPIPGTFVVNIGDQMARWTNGLFQSTLHRVANLSGQARHSIPCFVGPNPDAVIEALPNCVGPDNPAKFEPIVAGKYVSDMIYHNFHLHDKPNPAKHRAV
jgi:isopenicillin N synthase-like dioxygenase